jgi:hypothetical protein
MTFEKLKTDKAVLYARLLGFEPFGSAHTATKHFYWFMPEGSDDFSVHFFKGQNAASYQVNNQNTSSVEQACKWLQEIERKRNRGLTDIRAERTGQ